LPSLSILLGCRSMMILSTSISVSARRSTADRSSTQCVAADIVFHSLLHASRDCARCGLGCLSRAPLTMRYPESAVQFEHCQQIVADRTIGLFIGFLRRSDGLSAVAGGQCGRRELPAARRIAPVTSESRDGGHTVQYVKLQVWTMRCPSSMPDFPMEVGRMPYLAAWRHPGPASRCGYPHSGPFRSRTALPQAR
jgi:hypothetical protein